ncbi:hypothetical protein N0V93_008669 [Gnomoniopsis smithogilvyi]|uniref:Uncharacterized protein n=1 Tax=Gnomoniopsis smithogilvyi TaxID=1191159 RepID=A0A9W8YNG8_9PEZI|nr:hypothetical protein N0V93_008669 [Gnomoniopsis smithogilvyi]
MGMNTASRSGQLCPRCAHRPHVPERVHPQPLLTAIPDLLSMSKQVIDNTVGLVLDPWSWRARLVGSPPTLRKHGDESFQIEPSHKACPSESTKVSVGKRGKKTVQFVEPDHKKNGFSQAECVKSPAGPAKLELYEVVSPAGDIPRVINVNYDTNTNRWCIDESGTFPEREDPVAIICSKSALKAIEEYDTSIVRASTSGGSTSKPQFQVNRLPHYGVVKIFNGELAQLKASSHDLFHIGNLENFLLHTQQDPQRATSANEMQYMKHWLIELSQLRNMLSNPDIGRRCNSAFSELVRRGFVEKVTLQLWGADDPKPEASSDIETLNWITWVKMYKEKIPETLRRDLDQALVFFFAEAVVPSPWSLALKPEISIMSHKANTSGITTKARVTDDLKYSNVSLWSAPSHADSNPPKTLGKAGLNDTPTSTQQFVHASSPHPYPRPLEPTLPDALVARMLASGPSKLVRNVRTRPSLPTNARLGDAVASEKRVVSAYKLSDKVSLDSAKSVPPLGFSSPTIRSDESVASSNLTDNNVLGEEAASITDAQAPAKVDYGRETGGLVKPSECPTDATLKPQPYVKGAVAPIKRDVPSPVAGTSASEREQMYLGDPGVIDSRMRAAEIRSRATKSWTTALLQFGRNNEDAAPPVLDVDATGVDYPEFSYQLDEALDAEQRLARSVSSTQNELSKRREEWAKELERLHNESQLKRELRKELAKEWALLDGIDNRPQGLGLKTTDMVQDALRYFKLDDGLAQIEGISDKGCIQPVENNRLSTNDDNAVKAEVGKCKRQLDMANEAVMYARRMLDTANKQARETKDRKDQKLKELEKMKEDLVQLKNSLYSYAEGDQVQADVLCTVDCPEALFKDDFVWKRKGEPHSVPNQGAEAQTGGNPEQPMPTSLAPDDGSAGIRRSTPQQSNGGINGLRVTRNTPLTNDCQTSLLADARPCDTSNHDLLTPNNYDHPALRAGPPNGNNGGDSSPANGKVDTGSNHVVNRASSQADSDASREKIKFADTNGIPTVNEIAPNGFPRNSLPMDGTLTSGPKDCDDVCVADPEEIPNGAKIAVAEHLSKDILAAGPGDSDHSVIVASPEKLSSEVAVAGSECFVNNVRRSPSSPGKKKGATRKKGIPVKKGK